MDNYLKANGDPNVRDQENSGLIHSSVLSDNVDLVRRVLRLPLDVNEGNYQGQTPLHLCVLAASMDHGRRYMPMFSGLCQKEVIKRMIEDGKEKVAVAMSDKSLTKNRSEIFKLLFEKGAKADKEDAMGLTPLHVAGKVGCLDVVKLLGSKGAALDKASKLGRTPLVAAPCTTPPSMAAAK